MTRKVSASPFLSLHPPQQRSKCAMSSNKRDKKQRARWMMTPTTSTLSQVTKSWPQLTPWVLNSLTSYWLGLNRVGLQGFMAEKEKKRCFTVTFKRLKMQQLSDVLQLKDKTRVRCLITHAARWTTCFQQVLDSCYCLGLFATQPSIHHFTFSSPLACWQKWSTVFCLCQQTNASSIQRHKCWKYQPNLRDDFINFNFFTVE